MERTRDGGQKNITTERVSVLAPLIKASFVDTEKHDPKSLATISYQVCIYESLLPITWSLNAI